MPKIIPDLKNTLIESAKKHIAEHGYSNLKIRELAKGCNIAVGTVYNYFSSKQDLMNAVLGYEWDQMLNDMHQKIEHFESLEDTMVAIYGSLKKNYAENAALFCKGEDAKVYENLIDMNLDYSVSSLSENVVAIMERYGEKPDLENVRLISRTIMNTVRYAQVSDEAIAVFTARLTSNAERA